MYLPDEENRETSYRAGVNFSALLSSTYHKICFLEASIGGYMILSIKASLSLSCSNFFPYTLLSSLLPWGNCFRTSENRGALSFSNIAFKRHRFTAALSQLGDFFSFPDIFPPLEVQSVLEQNV